MHTKKRSGIRSWRWTKADYYRLGEQGFFHGQRVELIEGRLMVQSPQNALHAGTVRLLTEFLQPILPAGYLLGVQLPLDLGQTTEPEPDFAVVQGTSRQYLAAHPTSAVLIVEVSDSSVSYDRQRKGSLYARSGIPDYWIFNLVDNRVEVYRDPVPDPAERYGHRYASRRSRAADEHHSAGAAGHGHTRRESAAVIRLRLLAQEGLTHAGSIRYVVSVLPRSGNPLDRPIPCLDDLLPGGPFPAPAFRTSVPSWRVPR